MLIKFESGAFQVFEQALQKMKVKDKELFVRKVGILFENKNLAEFSTTYEITKKELREIAGTL